MGDKREAELAADDAIEGVVNVVLFGVVEGDALGAALSGDFSGLHRVPQQQPTAQQLDDVMRMAVAYGRGLGVEDKQIRKSIHANLTVYGYAANTFPIDRWMEPPEVKS